MNSVLKPVPLDALTLIQQKFCIIDLEGEIRILDQEKISRVRQGLDSGGRINFYKKPDGEMLMRRYLESLAVICKPKDVIADFWINPSTLMYNQIAFTPKTTPVTTLNYWTSYTVSPIKGNWSPISRYLHDVISDSDLDSFGYLIRFLAHMVQNPEEKPGVVVTLLGGQGTGKGVFFRLLRAIWTRTTLQVSDVEEVIGRFNASLERHYIVCMDEALFKGDKKGLDRLKSLVTEPEIRIEEKYLPSRSIESVHRFFAASNHTQIAAVERDDRRFFFLRVSDMHKQDNKYFESVCNAIDDDQVLGAMVHFLENLDLRGFDVRKRPQTAEHQNQKLKSLHGFERYWYEVLSTGDFCCSGIGKEPWTTPAFKSSRSLTEDYKEFDKKASRFESVQQSEIVKTVKTVCPSGRSIRKTEGGAQKRGFDLPNIETARKEFEKYLGCTIQWEDEEDADASICQD
jgi:hypothetical protein